MLNTEIQYWTNEWKGILLCKVLCKVVNFHHVYCFSPIPESKACAYTTSIEYLYSRQNSMAYVVDTLSYLSWNFATCIFLLYFLPGISQLIKSNMASAPIPLPDFQFIILAHLKSNHSAVCSKTLCSTLDCK